MFTVSGNNFITITRGEDASVPLFINAGDKWRAWRYSLKKHPGAKLYLGVCERNQPFEDAVIRKVYTSESEYNEHGDLMITFDSTDTEYLLPGIYYYTFKLCDEGGKITTIIPKTEFYIAD